MFKKYDIKETESGNDIALALTNRLSSLEKYLYDIEKLTMDKNVSEGIRIYQHFYKKIYNQDIDTLDENFLKILKRNSSAKKIYIGFFKS